VSALAIHEPYYAAFKSQRVDQNVARLDALQFRRWTLLPGGSARRSRHETNDQGRGCGWNAAE
jgi:hypothetical protein